MSDAHNPYAPPQAETDAVPVTPVGLAREGELVRVAPGGLFPDRCMRCDAPAHGYRIARVLYWRPGWWRAAIWITLPVIFVLTMFMLAIASSLLYRVRIARRTDAHVWLRGFGRPFCEALPLAGK